MHAAGDWVSNAGDGVLATGGGVYETGDGVPMTGGEVYSVQLSGTRGAARDWRLKSCARSTC